MTRRLLAVAAVLAIAAAAYTQVTPYARAPLVAGSAYAGQTHAQIATETSCGTLTAWYNQAHSVWKGGVRDGHDAQVEPYLDAMREIQRRKQWLEDHGVCGG